MTIETFTMTTHLYQSDMQAGKNLHTHRTYNSLSCIHVLSANTDILQILCLMTKIIIYSQLILDSLSCIHVLSANTDILQILCLMTKIIIYSQNYF